MFCEVDELGETVISFGLISKSLPISSISFDSVAEKKSVCLILGNSLLILIISGIKPMSNILSASSIISNFTSLIITLPLSI